MTDDDRAPFLATGAEGTWFLYGSAVVLLVIAVGIWWMPNDADYSATYNMAFKTITTVGCLWLGVGSIQSARDDGSGPIDWFAKNHAKVVWIHPTQHSLNGAVVSTWYDLHTNDGVVVQIILMTANVPAGEAVMRKYAPTAVWGVSEALRAAWVKDPASLPGDFR